jgi:hypothetical protein
MPEELGIKSSALSSFASVSFALACFPLLCLSCLFWFVSRSFVSLSQTRLGTFNPIFPFAQLVPSYCHHPDSIFTNSPILEVFPPNASIDPNWRHTFINIRCIARPSPGVVVVYFVTERCRPSVETDLARLHWRIDRGFDAEAHYLII